MILDGSSASHTMHRGWKTADWRNITRRLLCWYHIAAYFPSGLGNRHPSVPRIKDPAPAASEIAQPEGHIHRAPPNTSRLFASLQADADGSKSLEICWTSYSLRMWNVEVSSSEPEQPAFSPALHHDSRVVVGDYSLQNTFNCGSHSPPLAMWLMFSKIIPLLFFVFLFCPSIENFIYVVVCFASPLFRWMSVLCWLTVWTSATAKVIAV